MKEFPFEVLDFIQKHQKDDVASLALRKFQFGGFDRIKILQQITGLQIGKKKFPSLLAYPQYKFPPRKSLEQASSEFLAKFKSDLVEGTSFADLTGGMGIDTIFMSKNFSKGFYVEKDESLARLAAWNFQQLGIDKIEIGNLSAEKFLKGHDGTFDWVYLDPSRRTDQGRVIAMEQYSPNIIEIWDLIQSRSKKCMVKFSPMQDLHEIRDKLSGLESILILCQGNEVKEVVGIFGAEELEKPTLEIWDIRETEQKKIWTSQTFGRKVSASNGSPLQYLYEPHAGVLKASCQDEVAKAFGLEKLHPQSNFFTSIELLKKYPGRVFEFKGYLKDNKDSPREMHVISRNHPLKADQIKKKFQLVEKGQEY
ncbi:MAG: hypothetical protein HKN16_02190, partial [Saprospiraceae bacterium]|nr:hypothetical protein [Saprospiraceae bacterium]